MRSTFIMAGMLLAACGGTSARDAETPAPAAQESDWRDVEKPVSDGMVVEGIHGTISDRDANAALEMKYVGIQRCFVRRYKHVAELAGTMRLFFVIATDGSVKTVAPIDSNVGDRDTEKCVLGVVQKTRFPLPQGGEAEFTWNFTIDPIDAAHTANAVDGAYASAPIQEQLPSLAACGPTAGLLVTAYVRGDGSVLTAGAAGPPEATEAVLDCAALQVRSWTFPGGLGAPISKVSFSAE